MSDTGQGEGWWQASDGKWYPPEQHPDFQPEATQAMGAAEPPTAAMPPVPPGVPPGAIPTAGPMGPPPAGPPPGAPSAASSNAKWIIVGVLAVAAIAIAAFLLTRDDGKKNNVAATSSASPASTSSSSSSSSSSKSTSSSSKSSSSSSSVSSAAAQAKLLKASDIGADFRDSTFSKSSSPTPCGGPDIDSQVPPTVDVGADASNGTGFFEEELFVYDSEADADKVVALIKQAVNCPDPTVGSDEPATISDAKDVTGDISQPVKEAFAYDVQTTEARGKFFFVHNGRVVVSFAFFAQSGADTSKLPDELSIVNKGVAKLS